MRRAVITGIGPVTPIGIGKGAFWDAIKSKKSGIATISKFDASIFRSTNAAEITDWQPEKIFPAHRLKRLDRYAQFSVASVKLALEDSGLEYSPDRPLHRVGVSFGTALGGVSNAEMQHKAFVQGGPKSVQQKTLAL
jgi:3-oxoacyl-[acyl-carrier-protein] synthase II